MNKICLTGNCLSSKTVFLIIPPVGDSTMPMLGPHALAGYLKKKNIDCRVWDASIELLRSATDPSRLHNLASKVQGDANRPWLSSVINTGLDAMAGCSDSLRSMTAGLKLFSLLVGQVKVTPDDLVLRQAMSNLFDLPQVFSHVRPLVDILEESDFFQLITRTPGSVVGISVSFQSQLIMALALAHSIKTACSKCAVVFGGSYFSGVEYSPKVLLQSWPFVDIIVRGPGELVLETLAQGNDILCVEKTVQLADGKFFVDAQTGMCPNPNFDEAPWHLYASENIKAVPFSFYTECHYGKCRFCNGDKGTPLAGTTDAQIRIGLRELASLAEDGVVDCIYIVDAALPPYLLRAVAEVIGGNVRWAANARPTAELNNRQFLEFLSKGGCEMLRFGFESGSQKILNRMRKGTRVEIVSDLLENASAAGIRNHIYILLGYPGEYAEDRKKTIQFLQKHSEAIHSYSISVFQAMPGTQIYDDLCQKLALNKNNQPEAREAINTYLYPDEESFSEIRETIDTITRLLHKTSKGNRFNYSGRVFINSKNIKPDTGNVNLLGPFVGYSEIAYWQSYFSSVVNVFPFNVSKKSFISTFVDLVNDEIIIVESDIDQKSSSFIGLLFSYVIHRDINRLKDELWPNDQVRTVGWNGHVDNVIQNS